MFVGSSLRITVGVVGAPLGCGTLRVLLYGVLSVSRGCACLFVRCGESPLRAVRSGGQRDGALRSDVKGGNI